MNLRHLFQIRDPIRSAESEMIFRLDFVVHARWILIVVNTQNSGWNAEQRENASVEIIGLTRMINQEMFSIKMKISYLLDESLRIEERLLRRFLNFPILEQIWDDGCEQFSHGYIMDSNQCLDKPEYEPNKKPDSNLSPVSTNQEPFTIDMSSILNTTGSDQNDLEGTFKADELDVIYVTAPGGYKFRFKFSFEWELIQLPGNDTLQVNFKYVQ